MKQKWSRNNRRLQELYRQGNYAEVLNKIRNMDVIGLTTQHLANLVNLWDEAHYKLHERILRRPLTPLLKFRVRKRNPPPVHICPRGVRPSMANSLPQVARSQLKAWLKDMSPYPDRRDKENLAKQTGLTVTQVQTWFANARRQMRKAQTREQNKMKENNTTLTVKETWTLVQPGFEDCRSRGMRVPVAGALSPTKPLPSKENLGGDTLHVVKEDKSDVERPALLDHPYGETRPGETVDRVVVPGTFLQPLKNHDARPSSYLSLLLNDFEGVPALPTVPGNFSAGHPEFYTAPQWGPEAQNTGCGPAASLDSQGIIWRSPMRYPFLGQGAINFDRKPTPDNKRGIRDSSLLPLVARSEPLTGSGQNRRSRLEELSPERGAYANVVGPSFQDAGEVLHSFGKEPMFRALCRREPELRCYTSDSVQHLPLHTSEQFLQAPDQTYTSELSQHAQVQTHEAEQSHDASEETYTSEQSKHAQVQTHEAEQSQHASEETYTSEQSKHAQEQTLSTSEQSHNTPRRQWQHLLQHFSEDPTLGILQKEKDLLRTPEQLRFIPENSPGAQQWHNDLQTEASECPDDFRERSRFPVQSGKFTPDDKEAASALLRLAIPVSRR